MAQSNEYQVLARKYRPQTLEELAGQDHVATTLSNAIKQNRVAHAYLFTGARGVGKTSSARILAKALNCKKHDTPSVDTCNSPDETLNCENCREIAKSNSIDVFEIDAASNTGVDNVRELQEGLRYMPGKSRYKIYIIDEVHMLSGSAFNALLKTLEEPPAHVRFIFATTEPHKIPVTILSRCQRFDFKRISRARIAEQLATLLQKENKEFTDGAVQLLAHEAEGSMRDALSLTDQALSYAGGTLDEASVAAALGVIDRKVLNEAVRGILAGEPQALLELVDQVYDYGYDVRQFTKNMLEHFRNLLVVQVSTEPSRLVDLPAEDIEELKRQASTASLERLHRLFSALLKLGEDVSRSSHPRMVLEIGLVRVATLGPLQPVEELLGKLRDLSNRPPPIAGGLAGAMPSAPAAGFTPTPPTRVAPPVMPPPAPQTRPAASGVAVQEPPRATPPPPAAPPAAATPAPAPSPGGAKSGEGLLEHIRRTNSRISGHLTAARFVLEENRVILQLPTEQAFLLPSFKMALSEDLHRSVAEYVGRKVPVDVSIAGASAFAPSGAPSQPQRTPAPQQPQQQQRRRSGMHPETPADRERRQEAINHPAVQEVMRVFDSCRIMDIHLLSEAILAQTEGESSEQE
jgi:DNA polymerase-3 subunit gamma/tau